MTSTDPSPRRRRLTVRRLLPVVALGFVGVFAAVVVLVALGRERAAVVLAAVAAVPFLGLLLGTVLSLRAALRQLRGMAAPPPPLESDGVELVGTRSRERPRQP